MKENQIATFTGRAYPVYLFAYIVQETPDGNFLLFRGGNFQNHELVHTLPGVPNLSKVLLNHTGQAGLEQPPVDKLPDMEGYKVAYCYDVEFDVVGWGLAKEGINFEAYKNDPELRLYPTLKEAEAQVKGKKPIIITDPTQEDKPDFDLGRVGYRDGQRYHELLKELPGGEAFFTFFGQHNVDYPAMSAKPLTGILKKNGLVPIDLPTHSTTCNWDGGQLKLRSAIEMNLFDETGRLVWHLFDTKGGFHTNFGGANGNNHPDDSLRWIKPGVYKLLYTNFSEDYRVIQEFELSNVKSIQKTRVEAGQELVIELDLRSRPSKYHAWKLNCNFYYFKK